MLHVQTPVVNNPTFIELQYLTLKKFVSGDYSFTVYNDAKDWPDHTNFKNPHIKKDIDRLCEKLNIQCINIPNEHHKKKLPGSLRAADSYNYMLNHSHKETPGKYLLLDGDMFLINNLKTTEYDDYKCCYVPQGRMKKYMWNGLVYFDMYQINNADLLDWSCCVNADTGGATNKWLEIEQQKDESKLYKFTHTASLQWGTAKKNSIPKKLNPIIYDFCKNDIKNRDNLFFSELYGGYKCPNNRFLHYRAGGNWMKEGKKLYITRSNQLKDAIIKLVKD